jgi:hypothetical protein
MKMSGFVTEDVGDRTHVSVPDGTDYSEDFEPESLAHQTSKSIQAQESSAARYNTQSRDNRPRMEARTQRAGQSRSEHKVAGHLVAVGAERDEQDDMATMEEAFELHGWMRELPEAMLNDDVTRQTLSLIHKSIKVTHMHCASRYHMDATMEPTSMLQMASVMHEQAPMILKRHARCLLPSRRLLCCRLISCASRFLCDMVPTS